MRRARGTTHRESAALNHPTRKAQALQANARPRRTHLQHPALWRRSDGPLPAPNVRRISSKIPKCLVSLNQFHIDRKTEVLLRRGLSRKAARFYNLSDISRSAADKKFAEQSHRHASIRTLSIWRHSQRALHWQRARPRTLTPNIDYWRHSRPVLVSSAASHSQRCIGPPNPVGSTRAHGSY
jgi:hypothetical protein